MAAMSGAWLHKKVRHPWLGGPRRLTMYLSTLDCATSNPSLSSSPWMCGAPQSGFRRSSAGSIRSFVSICGRPPCGRDLQPVAAKAGPVPTHVKTLFQTGIGQMALAAENTQVTSIQKRDVDIAVGPAGAREDAE